MILTQISCKITTFISIFRVYLFIIMFFLHLDYSRKGARSKNPHLIPPRPSSTPPNSGGEMKCSYYLFPS